MRRVVLVLEPVHDSTWAGVPAAARLKRALKALGRSYGWRVVRIQDLGEDCEPAATARAEANA